MTVLFPALLLSALAPALELFHYPFMQRALIGGVITGLTGGLLGSFTVIRQLSFLAMPSATPRCSALA